MGVWYCYCGNTENIYQMVNSNLPYLTTISCDMWGCEGGWIWLDIVENLWIWWLLCKFVDSWPFSCCDTSRNFDEMFCLFFAFGHKFGWLLIAFINRTCNSVYCSDLCFMDLAWKMAEYLTFIVCVVYDVLNVETRAPNSSARVCVQMMACVWWTS